MDINENNNTLTKISISIVTHNSEKDITRVLSSISQCKSLNIDTTVIDNNSSDCTIKLIETNFPWVNLIVRQENLGYGRANNIAIATVESDYHIVVNPDVSFTEDIIQRMVDFMERNREIVLLVPKVLNIDGTEQFLPKKYPALRYVIGSRFEKFGGLFSQLRGEYTLKNEQITEPIDVDYATGCFMLFRTKALKEIHGFDERYFLYSEDVDIATTIKSQGRVVYVPNMSITHVWHRNTMHSTRMFLIQIHSLLKYYHKWGFKI